VDVHIQQVLARAARSRAVPPMINGLTEWFRSALGKPGAKEEGRGEVLKGCE
jgi:hypothetical protein